MRAFLPVLAILFAACAAATEPAAESRAAATDLEELTLPLDAKTLAGVLTQRGITSKSDALAILPRALKQRFVLVKQTGALGVASAERPRVIHFAEDGRFIVASTGYGLDEDSTGNSLEILEEDAVTHLYRTHTLTIDASGVTLTEDDARCAGCHGTPARPIWGAYPKWPGVYGEDDNVMGPEELASFRTFTAMAKTDPDYRHLEIHPSSQGFDLPTPYGYPNTVYGSAIGTRYAAHLAARMQASPLLPKLANALIADVISCPDSPPVRAFVDRLYASNLPAADHAYPSTRTSTRIWRLLGVEPTKDLLVSLPTFASPGASTWDVGLNPWDAGSEYLTNIAAFPIFYGLLKSDQALATLYASKQYAIEDYERINLGGDLAAMQSATTSDAYYNAVLPSFWNYVHEPVLVGEGKKAQVCAELDARQRAAQGP